MRSNWRLVLLLLLLGLNWLQPVHAQTKGSAKTIKIALAAPIGPTTLQSGYGPLTYGSEFGFSITADDMTVFASHAVAAQSVIAGQNNVVSGSFISLLLLRQAGQDFKMFCPVVSKIDHVIVGRNGIKTLAQVVDPQTRVGVDSPGGGGEAVLNALFVAHHLDVTVRDLKNVKRVDGLV